MSKSGNITTEPSGEFGARRRATTAVEQSASLPHPLITPLNEGKANRLDPLHR